ncbi:Fanconi anemia group A protein-like [Ruditapes philippinarum]|uniref:Fanconi anemia group A protein-like n=1 Tax=Ruditapes philippinarum TaxID=129788 RepID=UPI00295A759F|nr:Fanconi anemia group A protein-like [Ruditapes philippinarum]
MYDMAGSQDLLKETVFQLLLHNQNLDKTLSEVSSFRQACKDDNVLLTGLAEFGCLPILKSHDLPDGQFHSTEICMERVVSLYSDSGKISEDKTAEVQSLLLMMKQLKDTGKLNVSRLNDKLHGLPRIPLHFMWTLHQEGIFSIEQYFCIQKDRAVTGEIFVSKMCQACENRQYDVISGIIEDAVKKGNSDDNVKNEKLFISLSSVQLDVCTMKSVCTHVLTIILGHKPVLKGKIKKVLLNLLKDGQFLLPFEVSEVLLLLRQILEQQEVNWQLLLSFVSVLMVCMPETAKLFLEFTDGLLQEGLDSCEMETTIMGILLSRQACFQGPHVFLSYSDWFQRTFSEGSRSLASTRKSFTFLMKFLTDLVPYESAHHIKVHILHPPFVPSKCRQLLTDYIVLAKTRLEDLKESLDIPGSEGDSTSGNEKGKQMISEVENAVKLFETSGKVPTSILEASIFRKPYYIGQFLPALLHPRPLPDMPDSKMRLIASLKRADKIPISIYTTYEKGCKREASQLLEGVFIDSDTDDEMELSPFELLVNTLQLLKSRVKSRENADSFKHTVPEILSQLCGRVETVLSLSPHVSLHTPECVTIATDNPKLESLHLKVIDALLNIVNENLQICYSQQNPDFSWLTTLLQSLSQYSVVIETLYNRIFILTIKQGIHLENHHVDCVAAILIEVQSLWQQLPCVQMKCQGHNNDDVNTTLTACIIDILPVRTNSWMNLSLRLTTCCMKYMFSRYDKLERTVLIPILIKKFIYLSTRQNVQLCYYDKGSNLSREDNIVSALYMSENFQQIANIYPLTVSEWVDLEISVCPEDDCLTHYQRYEYLSWMVYSYFLGIKQEDIYSIASAVVQGIVKYDIRLSQGSEDSCECCEQNTVSPINSRTVLVNLVQELTLRFSHQTKDGGDMLPWLPQQLMNLLSGTADEIQQQCIVQHFLRLGVCLPGYLMFSDTLNTITPQIPLNLIAQFITKIIAPHLCEGLFLPASITVFLCQGICQVCKTDKSEETLSEMCNVCPVFMLSLMRYAHLVKHLLPKKLRADNPLQLVIGGARVETCNSLHTEKPWQEAGVLFSIAVYQTNSDEGSILKDYLDTGSDIVHQVKVLTCFVQMLFLQLAYIEHFEVPKVNCEREKLKDLLSVVLHWREGRYLTKMCFVDRVDEAIASCVNTKLERLMNVTIVRYFAAHQKFIEKGDILEDIFLTGILKSYSNCLEMLEEGRGHNDIENNQMQSHDMQSLDLFAVQLIQSIAKVHLRKVDKDLLLRCGPVIADCAIQMLSS